MKTVIELKQFVDFGVLNTNCIMIHSDKLDLDNLLDEFYRLKGIKSYRGLSEDVLRTINNDFISFLRKRGFKRLETQSIYFCD
jgi:hypothetical protein